MCRHQQLFTVEKSAGRNKVTRIIVPWTTGFSFPDPGGLLDQDYRLMEFFAYFMSADREAANKRLGKS